MLPVAFKLSMVERATNSFDAKQAHMLNFAKICCVGVLVDGALTFGRGNRHEAASAFKAFEQGCFQHHLSQYCSFVLRWVPGVLAHDR